MRGASECTRRRFLGGTAAAGVALAAAGRNRAPAQPRKDRSPGPCEEKTGKVIDCHAHLSFRPQPGEHPSDRQLIEAADKLGIDQLCCSILSKRPATVEGFRQCNDEGIVEMAAAVLSVDRLLFGCDMSMTAGVGKIRGARLSAGDKQKILGGNMRKLLALRRSK